MARNDKQELSTRSELSARPEAAKLTARQAGRLAELSGGNATELPGLSVIDIAEKHRFRIDPHLLFFRRVCGRVVRRDPITGVAQGVPFATVNVYDTDCSFFGYFPASHPWWAWLFPFRCHRELLATVKADRCGHWCAWIPRFDIDWILRFRLERRCYIDVLRKPTIRDLIERFQIVEQVPIPGRVPLPDPPPPFLRDGGMTYRRLAEVVGPLAAQQVASLSISASFGSNTKAFDAILDSAAPTTAFAPPLPQRGTHASLADHFDAHVSSNLAISERHGPDLATINFGRWTGPFIRCDDVLVPTWVPIIDIPDITFEALQDVDGDGVEEVIYSEGYFDVRWDAGAIPDVILEAGPQAIASRVCDEPVFDCTSVGLFAVGLHPLGNPLYDDANGYAVRPNRPHLDGLVRASTLADPNATAPFSGELQLYGCAEMNGATYYRVMASHEGSAFGPIVAQWPLFPIGGGVTQWVTTTDGWYTIRHAGDGYHPSHTLLADWYPGAAGRWDLYVELGNASKASVHTSATVPLQVDFGATNSQFLALEYSFDGTTWHLLGDLTCPTLRRHHGADVWFRVTLQATARRLQSVQLAFGGCGTTVAPHVTSGPTKHWYTAFGDDTFVNTLNPAVWVLPGTAQEGSYAFSISVASRAFSPAGQAGFGVDWQFDPTVYSTNSLGIAIVDI